MPPTARPTLTARGYGAVHTALPTDAGYGVAAARPQAAAYAGYHQTEAVSGSVAAARGAAVRTAYMPRPLRAGWQRPTRAGGRQDGRQDAFGPRPPGRLGSSLGWGSIQPAVYDYGTNVTYQDNQVYYGTSRLPRRKSITNRHQPWPRVLPPAPADDWRPWESSHWSRKSRAEPHYVMNLAVNKSGAIGGQLYRTGERNEGAHSGRR